MKLKATYVYLKKPPEQLRDAAVKIAVLDTGVDLKHPFIRGAIRQKRIRKLKSFVTNDTSTEDRVGHGTHVANLLLEVAPDAQLYIAKIASSKDIPSYHKIPEVKFFLDYSVLMR